MKIPGQVKATERAERDGVPQTARDLGIKESLLYYWRSQKKRSGTSLENQKLQQAELARLKRENQRLQEENAFLKIAKRLRLRGVHAGRHRVARIMRLNGWRAKAAKKFKAATNSNHKLPVAPNLLQQNFSARRPNEKRVSDITYVWTEEGWLYLAVVMDLYSRLIVGWSMSERMTSQLVVDALQMAVWRRNKPQGVIIHSDRGSQYCSRDYQNLLAQHGFICSMSKRGDCYDNGVPRIVYP